MKKIVLIKYFLILHVAILFSQERNLLQTQSIEDKLKFHLFDRESGLYNNVINSIEQDSLGYIWIATDDGISRYDGTKFKEFQKNDASKKGKTISNNYVKEIKINKEGQLLFATDGGLNIYNPRKEKFNILDEKTGLWSNYVSAFEYGPNGEFIIGAYEKGVQILKNNSEPEYYSFNNNNITSLPSNRISSLLMQGDSILWIGTYDKGLSKMHYKTKNISQISFSRHHSSNPLNINCLYSDDNGNVWIGSKTGIHVITSQGDTLNLKKNVSPAMGLSDEDILSLEEDRSGRIWIGTRNGGLNILEKKSFLERKEKYNIKWFLPSDDGSSVFNRTITSIKMDRDGNMWIGTYTGLNFVNPNGEAIKLLQKSIEVSNTLSHNRIGSVAQSHDGKIWIGTDGGGLDLYNPMNGEFEHYVHNPLNPKSLSNNYILSILEDRKKRLWIGTYRGGLNKMNPSTGYCKHYLQGDTSEGSDVRTIFQDSNNSIWVGTNRGGLYKYNEEKDEFQYIHSLGKLDIRGITQDQNGNLWMATYGNGIVKYIPSNDQSKFYNEHNTKGISSDMVFCILSLPDGNILAGTRYGGLVRLDTNGKVIYNFTKSNGLSNNTINSMTAGNDNIIWLGTFHGICYYNIISHEIKNINSFDNIQQSEFNANAALNSVSGYLYFGGNKGLNVFNPADLNSSNQSYPILLESIKIFNENIPITDNGKNGILQESITYQDHIQLAYNQSQFSIDFVTLKYPRIQNISYTYLLEGYHNHWIDTKNSGNINLSNIPYGDYILKIKAKIWPNKESYKQLLITITPPWWKTMPAYISYLLLAVIIFWAIAKYYSERVKLKNSLVLEKRQRQLEHDMNKERVRFFTGFSHELKTPLTLIMNPLDDLIRNNRNKRDIKNLQFIHKNAKYLFQQIQRLLEFRKSEVGFNELSINKHNVSAFLESLIQNYVPLAKAKGISLNLIKPDNNLEAWFDLEKIQIILHNFLSNAFKHCKSKDKIVVSYTNKNDFLKIRVKDSGPGINAEDLDHIFDWYYQSKAPLKKSGSGIGLALSKTFAELHKGKIEVESVLNQGATFTLSIPINDLELQNSPRNIQTKKATKIEIEKSVIEIWGPSQMEKTKPNLLTNRKYDKNSKVILLIDDNPDILKYLGSILEKEYYLLFAENGQEGLEKAIKYIPDLIVSDVMMPKKSGFDLCKNLKEKMETSHIPIILLTAKDNVESIREGYEEGADVYITKPFNSQLLLTRIKNLIDNREKLKDHFFNRFGAFENLSKEQTKLLDKEKAFINKLEQLILSEIPKGNTDVKSIAGGMGMSRTSLFRKLKVITGYNINEFIRKVRINRAAYLIEKENYGVSQAAYEVGFNDVKYFRKVFQEDLGKLPSDFSKKENAH
ncbi:hybrid sensor histidine kinase/response regulator transcription factor [Abyssalbus ytuae]|uniref:histidine kinase n=1 Tax=Abyssalbus ytuae TaxID=2926907 RepID=A0A9E7CU66_9FLAO|nr:two-component regulator propeller domain-containing protein [Abyssalbus ytuae]UOB17772.1 response regulator [Abyssalbus ytuae]